MSEEMIERHQGDEMIRLTLMDGQVRVMMCETTQMAQRAADIHGRNARLHGGDGAADDRDEYARRDDEGR